ncbi:MAG: hypothetical protein M1828_005097 [Chrysothrix sp. TS-e1954]|nr:MAG: hypothetical protein M1828_005097 [Chrysothrix sp. TS-e1954]
MEQPDKRPVPPPPPQPSWSPPQQIQDPLLPPAKRQRLSPPAPSPNMPKPGYTRPTTYATSPNVQNFALPNNAYNSQRTPMSNGYQSNSFNRQPMGPPQRPPAKPPAEQKEEQEKYMDVNDLSDLVTTSGIDLKREEELLHASFQSSRSFNSGQSSSGQSNFDLLASNSFGGIGRRGELSQQPEKTADEIIAEKHKRAARNFNSKRQAHLDDPFLYGGSMRKRIERICSDHGVKLRLEGLFDKRSTERPDSITGSSMNGTGQNAGGILAARAPSILHRGSNFEGILTLLSLSANERLRGLLEDAYGLARGRQITSTGVVPAEWGDIAVSADGVTKSQPAQAIPPESITGTSWDQPPDSLEPPDKPQPTISFPPESNPVAKALALLTKMDREAEEARLKKRAERKARKAAAAGTPDGDTAQSSATVPIGEKAPEIKMSKKEREKLAKQDISEEVATRNANATASLALGGSANKYSWMTKASTPAKPGGLGGSRAGASGASGATGTGTGTGTPGSGKGPMALGKDGLPPLGMDPKFGVFREDGPGGKDVQLRDWINVLETDGRERKTLCFATSKLGREQPPPE